MKKLIYKTIPFEIKDINRDERTLWAVGTTEGFDRDGDRIRMDGWEIDNYLKNPVILWAHNYREPPIGKSLAVEPQANGMWFNIQFANTDKAREIFDLYADEFMRAWSVGFFPKESEALTNDAGEPVGGKDYIRQELLELSAVPVPSNPDALNILRTKGLLDDGDFDELDSSYYEKPYPNEHSCRLKDPGQYDTCRRGSRQHDGKTYYIIFCKRTGGDMEEQAYRYPKDTWTVAEAKAHCKDHEGRFEAAAEAILCEICRTEIDAEPTLESETDEQSAELEPTDAENGEPVADELPDDIVAELLRAVKGIKEVYKCQRQ